MVLNIKIPYNPKGPGRFRKCREDSDICNILCNCITRNYSVGHLVTHPLDFQFRNIRLSVDASKNRMKTYKPKFLSFSLSQCVCVLSEPSNIELYQETLFDLRENFQFVLERLCVFNS